MSLPGGIEQQLREWADAGLVTSEQADAIREFEAGRRLSVPRRRIPLAAEAIGYLGGALAVIAVGVFVAEVWDRFETWARLSTVGLATVVLWAAGWLVSSSREPALRRLVSFLWLLSAAGVAFFAGLLLDDPLAADPSAVTLGVGAATAAWSLVLWRWRQTALQQVPLFAGVLVAAVGSLMVLDVRPPELAALAVWTIGVAWLVLAWGGLVPPATAGFALGGLAVLAGAQVLSLDDLRAWGLLLGMASAAGLMGSSVVLGRTMLLAFGAAGIFLFVPQAVFEWFGDTLGAPLALFVAGVLLMGTAVAAAMLRRRVGDEESQ